MSFDGSTRQIASAAGLAGFAVAVAAGLSAGNSSAVVLTNAILAMVVCNFVGLLAGSIGMHVVREHAASLRPAPGAGASNGTSRESEAAGEAG